jgi:hypothetical protein
MISIPKVLFNSDEIDKLISDIAVDFIRMEIGQSSWHCS